MMARASPVKNSIALRNKRQKDSALEKQPSGAHPERKDLYLIVGIGASAGGLDAFKAFFENMPADSGMTFVLVQHLAP